MMDMSELDRTAERAERALTILREQERHLRRARADVAPWPVLVEIADQLIAGCAAAGEALETTAEMHRQVRSALAEAATADADVARVH